jgi:pimeloyl-ACP methyl ester carboxylesterase
MEVFMKKVYKSKQSETAIMELYDRQLEALNLEYEDLYVDTRFGKAHVVKFGKPDGKPLLIFHGGNNTTPYSLRYYATLPSHFCSYAVDTVGHPGKSSQTVVSHKSLEYGEWASDVITGLGFEKMNCMGASFGGGILVKLMCAAPEKVEKSVLIVPSGFANVSTFNLLVTMGIPMMLYIITKKDKWLEKAVLPMLGKDKAIDEATYEVVKHSFEHVAVKAGMPSNAKAVDLRDFTVPTFVIASENDCMFPGENVIAKAEKMISNLKTHLLKGQSHMFSLPDDVIDMIVQFINE